MIITCERVFNFGTSIKSMLLQETQMKKMSLDATFMDSYRSCCSDSKTRLKVKAMAHEKHLEFNADKLQEEDWRPLLIALKSDRCLHTLVIKSDFTGKQRMSWAECVVPPFHKQSIMDELVNSIITCMNRSDILSTVQLQSLPLHKGHIESLSDGIRECISLQNLFLTRFALLDDGLETLYESMCCHIRLNHIDFSGCSLSTEGANTIAKLIRTQRLARYDETWKQSLRYREPDQELLPGIRRITLNDNPCIGDDGFQVITHELLDDLWIEAIDFQNCGLTSVSGDCAIEFLKINNTISVLDITKNDKITSLVKRKVKQLLIEREHEGKEGSSSTRLDDDADLISAEASLKVSENRLISNTHLSVELHKTKTMLDNTKRDLLKERQKFIELENKKKEQTTKLAEKMTKELRKRKQIEKERDRLKKKLHGFLSERQIISKPKTKSAKSASTLSLGTKSSKNKKVKPRGKQTIAEAINPHVKVRVSTNKTPVNKSPDTKTLATKAINPRVKVRVSTNKTPEHARVRVEN